MSTSPSEKKSKRAELVKRLEALVPKSRLDAMLEEVDGRALVSSLPAEDVYATIVDVGLNDAFEVVQLSTPEQFRTYVDLAAWGRDRMDPIEVLHWLRAARGDDEEAYIQKVKGLDIEILELMFKKLITLYDREEDPDANPEGVTIETPENKWLVELNLEGADAVALRQLVMDLMAQSPFELSRFLEAVRWETPSELEETAYQFRTARLEDLGFPAMEEAVKLFAWVDPAKYAPTGSPAPGLAVQTDFVAAAFSGLDAHERNVLEAQVRYLVNSALVAEGAEPGDPSAIRRLSEQARDTLNLGLEHLCGGDPKLAAEALRERPLKLVFQVGFSLTLQLKRQVERMGKEPGFKFGDTWLALDEEAAALHALTRRRPQKAVKVPGAEPVPFRWRRELGDSEAVLQRVRAQRDVFAKLLGSSPAEVIARFGVTLSDLGAQRLFAAAAAWAEVTGEVKVEPFDPARVDALLEPTGRAAKLLPEDMVHRVLPAVRAELVELKRRDGAVDPKKTTLLPIAGQPVL